MNKKICSKCNELKLLDDFHRSSKIKDGRQSYCKNCKKIMDSERMTDPIKKDIISKSNKAYRIANRQLLYDYMKDKQCTVCNENNIACLQFDHIDETSKSFSISKGIINKSWKSILLEISKCRILCANCHAKRTAVQFNWYKDLL